MKRTFISVAAAALSLLPLSAVQADAPPPPHIDHYAEIGAGESFAWSGSRQVAKTNYNYWGQAANAAAVLPVETCTKDATTFCEQALIKLSNPLTQEEIAANKKTKSRTTTVTINGFQLQGPVNDFDLLFYESDAQGKKGALIGSDGDLLNTTSETVSGAISTTPTIDARYVLVHIVYYQVADSGYQGKIEF